VRPIKNIVWTAALAAVFVCLAFPARADAQGRRVFVRTVRAPVIVAGGFYADPFWFSDPFYDPWYGYQYPYGPYPPYYPYGYRYDPGASLRLEVKPRQAEVYVDNYYAGVVNDFDGLFQRLPITPGQHELTLYLDGYRTAHQQILVSPRSTFKVKFTMEQLGAGEQQEPRPQAPTPPPPRGGQPGMPAPQQGPPPGPPAQGPPVRRMPPQPMPPPGTARSVEASAYGSIAIRVQPADADVLIDGEKWNGSDRSDRLVVELPEGRHTVEIQKSGFRSYVTDVQVRSGDTTSLNVSLRSQDEQ
jgi:PEGA domain